MIDKIQKYFYKKFDESINFSNTFQEKKSTKIKIINKVINNKLECLVDINDRELYGKVAKLRLISEVKVIDTSPVDARKVLFKKSFTVNSGIEKIIIDLSSYKNFSYKGNKININLFVELVIDDAIFFDTKITSKIQESVYIKPKVFSAGKAIIDPKDNFNLLDNIKAIPFEAMVIVFGLSIIGAIIVLINTFIGFHDQFVNDAQTYFYSHYNSKGESSSPLFNSLASSGALGAGVWFMMKTQLRKYMTFVFKQKKFLGDKMKKYKLRDIVSGKSRVDLKNVELRVVACNMEKGQYVRGSGSNRRTVSFSEPVRALSLFKEQIDFIPRNTNIGDYIKGEVSFERMYKVLYPEQIISSTHGLTIHWEVQLINNKFIDQELIGNGDSFKYEYFLKG